MAQQREALAIKPLCDFFRFFLLLEIAGFQLDFHVLEPGAVLLGRTQRFALAQQVVPRKAVPNAHDVAHLAELGDALEQDHFHD